MARLAGLFGHKRRERELAAELESHLALHIEENLRAGMTAEEARRQALVKLGGVEQAKELYREQRGIAWVETLWLDLRYAARTLRKSPGFTGVAILTLALGIGATTAIFSVVYGALLRPLPYANAKRLVWISGRFQAMPFLNNLAGADYFSIRRSVDTFSSLGATTSEGVALRIGNESQWLPAARFGAGIFKTLGVQPLFGRKFLPKEYEQGGDQEVLLSYTLWQQRFGGEASVLGRSVLVNLKPYTVVGVMPPRFDFPSRDTELWMPLVLPRAAAADYAPDIDLHTVARLKQGVSLAHTQAELNALSARRPKTTFGQVSFRAEALRTYLAGSYRLPLLILLAAVGLLLLISCAGVANLLLARLSVRERETALRAALGATSGRVFRQLLTESMLLGVVGGAAGVVLAVFGASALHSVLPADLAHLAPASLNLPVLLFALGMSVASAVLFGVAPAILSLRTSPSAALKGAQRGAVGAGSAERHRARSGLVATEVALATILAVGGLLLFRSLLRLENVSPGFRTQNVLMFRAFLPPEKYKTAVQQREFYNTLLARLRALPGVRSAAFDAILPFTGWGQAIFDIKGRDYPKGEQPRADMFQVSPGYFQTMGIPLVRGRTFRASDATSSQPVAVIDQDLARTYWPHEDPIGQEIKGAKWMTIVGVVGHVRFLDLAKDPGPELYVPLDQAHVWGGGFVLHTSVKPESLDPAIRSAVAQLDPDVPLLDLMTLRSRIGDTLSDRRLQALLLGLFAALALMLTAVGIAGVISYMVSQRTREMGLRMALGAEPGEVFRLVLRGMLGVVGLGLLVGLGGAFALTRFLESALFGVGRWDPASFLGTAAVVLAVAFFASYLPARRAARVDPAVTLRQE
jgi:putative ABC transport system permease protein